MPDRLLCTCNCWNELQQMGWLCIPLSLHWISLTLSTKFILLCVGHLLIAGTNGQRVLITSVVPNQSQFCPREEVTITCVTRGSPTLNWRSNEYIEAVGNSLTLASFNEPGHTVPIVLSTWTPMLLLSARVLRMESKSLCLNFAL